jgi:hypothetical protein
MIRLTLLSNLAINDEERLSTRGPTNRQAKSNRHERLRDFSMFCSKKRTNWMTREGMQWMEAMM